MTDLHYEYAVFEEQLMSIKVSIFHVLQDNVVKVPYCIRCKNLRIVFHSIYFITVNQSNYESRKMLCTLCTNVNRKLIFSKYLLVLIETIPFSVGSSNSLTISLAFCRRRSSSVESEFQQKKNYY